MLGEFTFRLPLLDDRCPGASCMRAQTVAVLILHSRNFRPLQGGVERRRALRINPRR